MFRNCFFPLFFFYFQKIFSIFETKILFDNLKWTENKNCSQNSIYEGNFFFLRNFFMKEIENI